NLIANLLSVPFGEVEERGRISRCLKICVEVVIYDRRRKSRSLFSLRDGVYVVGGREHPPSLSSEKTVISEMIVDIVDHDVEDHASEQLPSISMVLAFTLDNIGNLRVTADVTIFE